MLLGGKGVDQRRVGGERGNRVGLIKTYYTHVRTYEILNFKKQRMTGLSKALLLYPWLMQSVTSSCSNRSKM